MSDSIPLMLSTSFTFSDTPNEYQPTKVNFRPVGGVFGNPSFEGNYYGETPLFGAWILDRSAPNNPVVFKTSWADPNEVPSGLSGYLSDSYILLFSFAGWINKAPAGDLYETLMQNGGGSELRRLQSISTALSCGVSGDWTYSLISVPGTGTPGVELTEAVRVTQGATYNLSPGGGVFTQVKGPYALSVELVQGTDGKYTPVRLGV